MTLLRMFVFRPNSHRVADVDNKSAMTLLDPFGEPVFLAIRIGHTTDSIALTLRTLHVSRQVLHAGVDVAVLFNPLDNALPLGNSSFCNIGHVTCSWSRAPYSHLYTGELRAELSRSSEFETV